MNRSAGRIGAALLALAVSSCGDPPPPHLVVITIDTLRADHLATYGYFRETSPHLDRLAEQAVVFERCVAPMATTLPSHVSLFTGTAPLEHGVLANLDDTDSMFVRPPSLMTLPEFASESGYRTGGFISATPLKRGAGLPDGFEQWVQPSEAECRAEVTMDAALAWLDELPDDEPFFCWIHLFDPHGPYEPPEGYQEFEHGDEAEDYLMRRRFENGARRLGGKPVVTREAMHRYDGEILYADAQIGRLFDWLRDEGLWKRTGILVVGDHGEGLGQHGDPGHGLVWDEQLHVPCILRVPGSAPLRVRELTALSDAVPTWLELLAFPNRNAWLEQASGFNVLARRRRAVLSLSSERRDADAGSEEYAWREDSWKLIHVPGGEDRLYWLERDPFELEDLAAQEPEIAARLRERLQERMAQHELRARELGAGRTAEMSAERLGELRQLGYVEDEH